MYKNYIPRFRLHGPQTLKLVSKNWKNILDTLPKDPHYKFPESILEDCKTPEDALFLLKDNSFTDYLTNKQLLGLMAKDPRLGNLMVDSIKLMRRPESLDEYSLQPLCILGAGNAITAQYILESNLILDKYGQVHIAAPHEAVAHALLNSSMVKELHGRHLALLGRNYLTVATTILEDIELSGKLSEPDYEELGSKNSAIKALIVKHVEQAKIELSNFTWAKLLTTEANLRQPLDSLRVLYESLGVTELYKISEDPIAEKYIASIPTLARKLIIDEFFPGAALDPAYSLALASDSDKIEGEYSLTCLFLLSQNNSQAAEIIFNNPIVKQRLLTELNTLISFGVKHSSIGLAILKDPTLYRKIPGKRIVSMVISNFKLAKYCVENKALREYIGVEALAELAKYPKISISLCNFAEKLYGEDLNLVLAVIEEKEARSSMQLLINKVLKEPLPQTKLKA